MTEQFFGIPRDKTDLFAFPSFVKVGGAMCTVAEEEMSRLEREISQRRMNENVVNLANFSVFSGGRSTTQGKSIYREIAPLAP